jgi:DNA-directed RNA polymerase I, II, and III subunit RPABC2
LLQQIFLAAKSKSSKKVKEKESAKARVETETKSKKEKVGAVIVAEVAEVTEPLEVVETEKVERIAAPVEEVRPEEIEQELRELKPKEAMKIVVGPPRLTRFERARIIGARALQLSLGAPPLVAIAEGVTNAIMMAAHELEQKALPISLRRVLPNGQYQDIPLKWLLEN